MTQELLLGWPTPSLDLLQKPQPLHNHRAVFRLNSKGLRRSIPRPPRGCSAKRAAIELRPELLNPPRPSLRPLRPRPIARSETQLPNE